MTPSFEIDHLRSNESRRKQAINNIYKFPLFLCLTLLLLGFGTLPALAIDGRAGDTVTIGADEVVDDDLYVGAQTLVIDGVVKGDVFFGVTTATINGTVEGDINGGAQSVIINGTVDDVRVGLTSLTLSEGSNIQGDLLMGGFSLDAQSGSNVDGDLLLGAGQARLAGRIGKDVMAGVNGLEILGSIGGDVDATVGTQGEAMPFNPGLFMQNGPAIPNVLGGLTVGESASIGGELNYSAPRAADVGDVAAGGTTFELEAGDDVTAAEPTVASQLWQMARRVIALVLLGLFFAWLFRRPILRAADQLDADLGSSALWGVITTVIMPFVLLFGVGVLIALALLFGVIQLGLISQTALSVGIPALIAIATAFVFIWGLISKVIVGYWLGRKMFSNSGSIWIPLLIGIVLIAILSSVPYLGLLVNIVVAVMGVGAIWLILRESFRQQPEPIVQAAI